jgi:hypothetical protein
MPCPAPPNPPGANGHIAAATTTMENNSTDFQEMATEQENCAETQKLISGPTALTISFQTVGGHRLAGDTSPMQVRPHPHRSGWPTNNFFWPHHILTIIDRTSRWMEAIPLTNTAATSVAAAIFSGRISRFGVPNTITSDRGLQFTSNNWNSLCLLLQIKHWPTTAYHPQANGMVERLHRRLKDALRTRGANATWAAELPWVLLGLRSQPREDSNISPAQAVYGTPLVLPNQYLSIDDKCNNE